MSTYQTGIPPQLQKPINSSIEPPVETRLQELPFDKLIWENFEKLCLRLVQTEANVEGYCQLYGERGDEQAGIDLYARKHLEEKYTVYQCKRVKDFGAAKIKSAVDKFLEGDWVDKSKTFVLCTSESLVLKQRADAVEEQRKKLLQKQIELIIWDRKQLSSKLKELPQLVSDFFGDAWTKAFCGQSLKTSLDTQVITDQYLDWMTDITASFLVPGLGKKLSIETAWIPLKVKTLKSESQPSTQTVKEQLAKYHQDSKQSEDKELIIDIDNVDEFSERVVFIGRSGTGKSTALKRLAHFLAENGRKVLLIRLSKVAKYFDSGVTFEDALLMEAVDSSGIDRESLKAILSHPEYLLADGLDECSSQQALIAHKLVEWSTGHPQTKIILTSRPFGYDLAYLPEWQCLDILSLESKEFQKNSQLLLNALFNDKAKVEKELNKFVEQIQVNKTASVAAQNPLLLGFLLQLSINGIELVASRSGLYKSIVNLAYQQSVPDREFKIELDEPVAYRVLDIIGWHLQQNPDITKQDLVKNIGKEIAEELDLKYLAGQKKAQQGIYFWEERRITELFKIGNKEFVTFAHLSLQEYSAGSYAATLNTDSLNEWLEKVRRQAKYRETILFAASAGMAKEICECLLELDDDRDPTSIEAILAAEALIETKEKFSDLAEHIVERLKPRLESEIPHLVFEAAEKLLNLVPQAKETIGSLASSLSNNKKSWVRLSGIRLGLECGANYVDLEVLTDFLNEFAIQPLERDFSYAKISFSTYPKINRARYYGGMGWEFQNQIIPLGVKLLLEHKPDSETNKCIENLKEQGSLSSGTHHQMEKVLMNCGIEYLKNGQTHKAIQQIQKTIKEKFDIKQLSSDKLLRTWKTSEKKAEIAFLESILRIEKSDSIALPTSSKSPQSTLAKLFAGMKWWNQTTTAWDVLGNQDDIDVIDTVIAGAIAAMRINFQQLAEEALQALEKIKESNNTEIDNSKTSEEIKNIFGSPLTQPSFSPSWELAKEINLCPENLVRALKHPSDGIRYNAVHLIAHGAGGSKVCKLVEKMLREENDEKILWAISNVTPNICGEQTLEMFLEKLNQPLTKGSCYLLKYLPQICKDYNIQDKSKVFSILLTALKTENPRIATSAGEALSEFEINEIVDLGSQIKKAFDWWIERGTWCDRHQITTHERSCPKCRTILDRPQSKLVNILTKLELVDNNELIDLCTNSKNGIQDEAVDSLVQKAASNKTLLIYLLEKIYIDESLAKVLIKLLTFPSSILITAKTELIKLCNSNSVIIREIAVRDLQNSEWLEKQEAISLLENALVDEDITIRNQAVVSLRSIKNIDL